MKFIFSLALIISVGSPAFASTQATTVKHAKKKHHVAKHKKSAHASHKKQPQQVRRVDESQQPPARTVASRDPVANASSRKGALYVSKYFQKSVYTNTEAGK